ncbi:hypothetical protein WS87_12665 [Burkholderia sp. MSMB0856]|uniref:hypothetical protein n=1 Tax=Burkholderia sp. MSMB0856 TaxID=1637869 RepID=UPI0008568C60|nr:hypothetical protein [Burkholderia sp. MSMB0856]AOJ87467.1 hypothetical protein WS87_12665 [Burkholderia sp. MSMB0856]
MANRQPDAAGLLAFLWDHFDANTASDEDLEYLAVATGEAVNAAFKLGTVISGIACLVGDDRGADDNPECGALQDGSQSTLLHFIADEVETIGRLAYIGSESDFRLRTRLKERLATSTSRRIKYDLQSSTDKGAA